MKLYHIFGAIVGSFLVVLLVTHITGRHQAVKQPRNLAQNDPPAPAPYENRRDWPSGQGEKAPSPPSINYAPIPAPNEHGSFTQQSDGSDPRAQLEDAIARLKESGPARENLDTRARTVFDTWRHDSKFASGVTFKDPECFAAGCSVVAEYADLGAYLDMSRDFESSQAFLLWPRPKFRSAPFQTDSGHVEATWVLMK